MVHPTVEAKKRELTELCQRHGVRRLELFGSATSERFNPVTSDLDFLVEFAPAKGDGGYADRYFGLLWGLEELFGRTIDLLETPTVRNPYLLKAISPSRTLLYAA